MPAVKSFSPVCNVCIVTKQYVLTKICLKNERWSGLWGIEWSRDWWCHV